MKQKFAILLAVSGAIITALPVHASAQSASAAEPDKHAGHHSAKAASTDAKLEMVDAEVKKVDKDAKNITLKHGPIKSLDMPGMTMVFQVKDGKLLDNVKPGDKVKVSVEQTKSGYSVTSVEAAK